MHRANAKMVKPILALVFPIHVSAANESANQWGVPAHSLTTYKVNELI